MLYPRVNVEVDGEGSCLVGMLKVIKRVFSKVGVHFVCPPLAARSEARDGCDILADVAKSQHEIVVRLTDRKHPLLLPSCSGYRPYGSTTIFIS